MSAKKHIQTQSEWEADRAKEILEFVQSELYLDLPYMGIALGAFVPQEKEILQTLATDGEGIYYNATRLIDTFQKNMKYLDRVYLHSVLHCLFSHLWIKGDRDFMLWSVSCDIAVEYVIDHMNKPSIKRALSGIRQRIYEKIEKELSGISAATIYLWLAEQYQGALSNWQEENNSLTLDQIMREFYADDHRFWPKEKKGEGNAISETQSKWDRMTRQTSMEQKKKGEDPDEGKKVLASQVKAGRHRRSYQEFLKKFAVLHEELHANEDEFDLNYYTYGLRLYKNMPLVEPQETREIRKIKEFVIVVDTSYSTSGELIKSFLKETFTILSETDSFFQKSRIRIIQCDDNVQMDEVVEDKAQMEALMNRFTIVGGGGTDFRPAFFYVNELLEKGKLKDLSGLLYFTDGKGIYPGKRPGYQTAFLYLEDYEEEKVPAWAIRLRLYPEEFGGKK